MVFIDPPYNVDYEGKAGKIKNDKMSMDEFHGFLSTAFKAVFNILEPGGGIYVAHADAGPLGIAFRKTFIDAGFKLASCLVWRKNQFILGRADYHWQHEPILYGWKPGAAHRFYGGRKQTTIQKFSDESLFVKVGDTSYQVAIGSELFIISGENIKITPVESSIISEEKPHKSDLHPTMKPVPLVSRFVKNSSRRGQTVVDTFGGSGTTLISCEQLSRSCRMMELDPRFCDVIVDRWQNFTGQKAMLEGSIFTFIEKRERRLQ